jgi:hypothetical protein
MNTSPWDEDRSVMDAAAGFFSAAGERFEYEHRRQGIQAI